jgi:hypothetical protein
MQEAIHLAELSYRAEVENAGKSFDEIGDIFDHHRAYVVGALLTGI